MLPRKESVAVIIINWNGLPETIKCVNSVLDLTYPDFQVVVVDNGSSTNEASIFKKIYGRRIHSLRSNQNRGYSAGINYGIRYVLNEIPDTQYFLISNNDVTFRRDFLEGLIEFMEKNPYAGVATGKIMVMGTRDFIFSVGQKWNLRIGFVKNIGFGEEGTEKHLEIHKIDFVPGAAFIVRRSLIERIGLLDEQYFLYFEEPDYCIRAKKAGYETFLVPQSIAFHRPATSTRKVGLFAFYCYEKSHLRFIVKHFNSIYLPVALTLNLTSILISSGASSIKRRNLRWTLFAMKAILETLVDAKHIRCSP